MANGNLWDNNLFLSLLSQGGASLAGEGSIAAGVNPILQGTIAAQSKAKEQKRQMEMLSKLLGQGVDFKSSADGKVTINAETIDALSSLLGGGGEMNMKEEASTGLAPDATQIQPTKSQGSLGFLQSLLNPPSSSPDVPAYSDLVGLTPQDMSQALAGAQQTELLKSRVASDLAARRAAVASAKTDTAYKQALTKQAQATTKKTLASMEDEIQRAPLAVPGIGTLTMDQWKSLDTKTKAYSYYAYNAKQNDETVMPYSEWSKQTDEPTAKQLYDLARVDPDFRDFYFESKRAGATQVSVGERELEKAGVAGQTYFKSGKFINDLDDYMSSEEVQNKLFATPPEQRGTQEAVERVQFIEQNIISRGGTISDIKFAEDGKTMVWTVEWPSGDTEEVKHVIRR
jgi:hypothetical protein